MSDGRVASASGSAASRARLGRVSTSGHLSSRLLPHGRAGSAGRPGPAGTAAYPAAGYPNWTLTPADAAFANQPGLLRQQITTDPVASGAQPVLYTGSDAAPDRVDSTIDYTGQSALAPSTAWRSAYRASESWRHGVAAQGIRRQPGELPAIRGFAHDQQRWRPQDQHRGVPSRADVVLRNSDRDVSITRPRQRDAPAVDVLGHAELGRANPPRPSRLRRRQPDERPVAVGSAG